MSEIRSQLNQYVDVCDKIKFYKKQLHELNQIKQENESLIKKFLQQKNFKCITYKNYSIELRSVNRTQPASRAENKAREIEILRQTGIRDPEQLVDRLRARPKIKVDTLRIAL